MVQGKTRLRIVFLVGDAPPHMDYKDDVKYPETCKRAFEKGILINTIQCGNDPTCRRHWQVIAAAASGEYVAIAQSGGVVVVTTPFDAELIEVGRRLFDTALIYGDAVVQREGAAALERAKKLAGASAADRVAFAAKSRRLGPFDLIDAIRLRGVKLESVGESELPSSLRGLSKTRRHEVVQRIVNRRAEFYAQAVRLEEKRAVAQAGRGKGGFDAQVLGLLRKQAAKFDIKY